jgi:hypothetical protein
MKIRFIRIVLAAVALTAAAGSVSAQSPISQAQVERRYNVRVFGNVLVSAAQHGAELMALRVQQIDPGVILISGNAPRAQGFVIDGHGVFFHVEIPRVDPMMAWAVTNRGRDQAAIAAINDLRSFIQTVSDVQQKQWAENRLKSLEQRVSPPGMRTLQSPTPGTAPSPSAAPPVALNDPNLEYESLVTNQLVNAMLDHSHQLGLGADEWLTIAARGSQGPMLAEAVFDDSVTITLRIKGSDLADLRAGRITRDDARKRVVVREF